MLNERIKILLCIPLKLGQSCATFNTRTIGSIQMVKIAYFSENKCFVYTFKFPAITSINYN